VIKTNFNNIKIYWEYSYTALLFAAGQEMILAICRNFNHIVFGAAIFLNFMLLALTIWYVNRKNFYEQFEKAGQHGIVIPFAILSLVIWMSIVSFSALTYFLSDIGYVSLNPTPAQNELGAFNELYFWHFFDLIPEIKIHDPLQWKVPYTYTDKIMPWIVFIYKVGVVGVIIKQFSKWNKWRKGLYKTKERDEHFTDNNVSARKGIAR